MLKVSAEEIINFSIFSGHLFLKFPSPFSDSPARKTLNSRTKGPCDPTSLRCQEYYRQRSFWKRRLAQVGLFTSNIFQSDVSPDPPSQFRYPTVWLRDNCRCPSCFHPVSRNRTILMRNLDLNARPRKCELDNNGEQVDKREQCNSNSYE